MERAATPDETAQIKALLGEAIDAGAFGFSTTILNQHVGFEGRPLACRNASRDELKAYANVLKERGKGAIEIALTRKIAVLDDEEYELLDFLLRESGRHVTFLALFDRDDIPEAVRDTLRKAAPPDCARRPAADLAAAADARHQHAQPVLLRGVPELEPGVRRQVEAGPGGGLRRPGLPQPVSRGAEAADGLRQLGAHQRARGPVAGARSRSRAARSRTSPASRARTASTPSST